MKRKFRRNIGEVMYNADHNFFSGRVNGSNITMNLYKDPNGKEKWLIQEELNVFEVFEQPEQKQSPSPQPNQLKQQDQNRPFQGR
jgi:hypothetical protein